MAMMGAKAHEAKFRAMPMTTIMHISFRCEHAKKTVRPQEYVFCDVQKQLEPCTLCELGYGHDGSKGSRG